MKDYEKLVRMEFKSIAKQSAATIMYTELFRLYIRVEKLIGEIGLKAIETWYPPDKVDGHVLGLSA